MEEKKENKMFSRRKKQYFATFGVIILLIALSAFSTFSFINAYKQNPFRIPFFTAAIEWRKSMDKIIEDNIPELCMVNGNVLVKISDEQVARTYGKDRLIDADKQERKGFCFQKNDTEKIMTFVLENGETIKEIVTIERLDGQVIMKRPNGYVVTLVK